MQFERAQIQTLVTPIKKRKGLLFAGTELGVYISFNDGKNWERFNLNMPSLTITDLMIKHDDLIIATQGEWEAKGWIHKDDPRGWFEWYCKFFNGRRHEDDERQIKRWLAFCGPRGRFRNSIYNFITHKCNYIQR